MRSRIQGTDNLWILLTTSAGKLQFYNKVGLNVIGTTTITTGAWHHVAVTKAASTIRLFLDGALEATAVDTTEYDDYGYPFAVGSDATGNANSQFFGYIDELRVTKGVARYTASFSPPTGAFGTVGSTPAATGNTTGDLYTVTNAQGHVTTYNLYDPNGRVRQITDPKGVVTDVTYTPRGFVSTVVVAPPGGSARTTSYTYDDAGQLTGASLPDGASLTFTYDAAHRLTGITDQRGNTVTYTLDNSGNRVGEEVRDSTNTLQRTIARSYDALNRVQQVTGAKQ